MLQHRRASCQGSIGEIAVGGPTLSELNSRLTEARAVAEQKGRRQEFAIQQGLRVRVYPTTQASFAYRYKAPGTNALRTVTLAPIGKRISASDLETVQELHRATKRERDAAIDPLQKRDQQRKQAAEKAAQLKVEKARQAYTVKRLTKEYLDEISGRKRSWKEDERIFERYVIPVIGKLPVEAVDLKAVRKVLGKLEGKVAMKRNVAAACRTCWKWHGGPNPWREERTPLPAPRERVLSLKELRDLLKRLDSETGMGRDIVELILLTGVRREEASSASREEFEGGEWRMPPGRMKGGRSHVVLLSKQAKALVGRVLASHESEWLFPSPRLGKAIAPEFGYKWLKSKGATYTLHDLRSTLSSHLGEQLVHDAVIDRILAHRKQGVIKHYNVAKLNEPARKAWQDWANYLDGLRKPSVSELKPGVGESLV